MTEHHLKISIITVCYNAAPTIEETILSVLNQTYDNLEYIIIDGGSTDGTVNIIKKYSNQLSYWVSEPDKGIYDAMNKGIEIATGDYINFMNSGDSFYDTNVVKTILCDRNSEELIYGDIYNKYLSKISGGTYDKYRLTKENICHQSIFYPAKFLKERKFKKEYPLLADWVLNLELWNEVKFSYRNIIVANYEGNGLSKKKNDDVFKRSHRMLTLKYLGIKAFLYSCINSLKNKALE